MTSRTLAILLAIGAFVAPVDAHQFWVAPRHFGGEVGHVIALQLYNGQGYRNVCRFPRRVKHLARFEVACDEQVVEVDAVRGARGGYPAGAFTPTRAGWHIAIYRSHPTAIELPAARFEEYLEEEGMTEAVADRRRRGEDDSPGREQFSRSAKSLIEVVERNVREEGARDTADDSGFDRIVGLPLELVPLASPRNLDKQSSFPVRLLWHGKPLAHHRVLAFRRAVDVPPKVAETDADGVAILDLSIAGEWLISAVRIERLSARQSKSRGADWASEWSSLTLAIQKK